MQKSLFSYSVGSHLTSFKRMLETEEVDVDYFTPSSSTSLSKIFGSSAREEDNVIEKSSLKYNAPLPPQVVTKPDEPKQTQYLFAGTVYAYEWVNNLYEFRGRLGFAISKIARFYIHKMVLYDSNKTTLSSLTIAQNIEIKVNGNISISYYDNLRKFWSVNPSSSNLKEILEILQSLNVNLEFVPAVQNSDSKTPLEENINTDKDTINKLNEDEKENDEKENDTDGSFDRKTKDSILKRMATMGQSVLPPPHVAAAQTSDSSDTNEPYNKQKPRHKPKVANKKSVLEKKSLDADKISEVNARKICLKSEPSQETYRDFLTCEDNQQIVPLMTTNIVKSPNDFDGEASTLRLFISEQKVSNSELIINMNKMTNKLDMLLDKVKDFDIVDKGESIKYSNVSQFQNEIIQKLLNEYEKKINKYEEFIKLKGFDYDSFELTSKSMRDSINHERLKNIEVEDQKLLKLCIEKDKEIIRLKEELQLLSNKEAQFQNHERSLLKQINDLKKTDNHTAYATKQLDITNSQTTDVKNKLKQIMNDTFQAISANFGDEEQYSGSQIKSIVGLVVKKTTIDSLKELF